VLRVLVARWLGLPVTAAGAFVIDPASITTLGRRHGRPVVVTLNDRAHLAEDLR
jgi:probable phosphoglycerate mutase